MKPKQRNKVAISMVVTTACVYLSTTSFHKTIQAYAKSSIPFL